MSPTNKSESNNKRRKTTTSTCIPRITDIPDEALAAVAEFLAAPSRALFALAMTAPRRTTASATSRAILGLRHRKGGGAMPADGEDQREHGKWTTLDFGDVDEALAGRLSDDDVFGVLTCIDGANVLRTLKLTGCVGLTGSGLEPLRGSTALEQIDLSLSRRHGRPAIATEPSLSEGCVLPILDSVIDAPENSLRHIQLPKEFRGGRSPLLDDFIEKYDEFLEGRGGACAKCLVGAWGNMDGGGNPWVVECHKSPFYGLQNYTCYECTNHFCTENDCVGRCVGCEREYCTDCVALVECASCRGKMCARCREMKECDRWGKCICETCVDRGRCCAITDATELCARSA
ncbi:hypothetical protein ACHAW5_007004 [Stephanodiscus triporus]|uniref:F-box domain-containing protein n=1 Tax=Stephanodiscus triporus TaxID=2934178 RepID=A0ABD3P0L8_9STRA